MKGKKVRVQLNTPIDIEVSEEGAKEKIRLETIFKIYGTITEFGNAGVEIEISDLFNEKNLKILPPYRSLFLPYHKIDYLFSAT